MTKSSNHIEPQVGHTWSFIGYGKDDDGKPINKTIRLVGKTGDGSFEYVNLIGKATFKTYAVYNLKDEWRIELGPEIKGRG